jgi:hypothetical protein
MLDHLSYSSISTYLMCPRAWRYRYIDQVTVPTGTALVFGKAFHETVEAHVAGSTTGDALVNRWAEHWETARAGAGEIAWGEETPESLYNLGLTLLSNADVQQMVNALTPLREDDTVHIEDYIELRVPGVPIPIIGYIDIITADGVPGDFKTSSRRWYANRAESELQPAFYLAALNQNGYLRNPERKFRHYVFVKTQTPQAQVLETTRTAGDLLFVQALARNVWDAIQQAAFPMNPTTWKCSPKWCEYWGLCRGRYT